MSERDIFTAAREIIDPAARSAYLDGACGGDPGLRSRVEALLRAHDQPNSLLDHPAVAAADVDNGATQALTGTPAPGVAVAQTTGGANGASDDEALSFLSPSQRPDSLGRLGHYEVLQVLGRGGFGIVFRAFDEMLQRVVALKVMALQLAATSPARKRFLREARSSAQVRHENVVQVYEVAEQPLPYLAMEFIPGETLQQRLNRVGPLDLPEVLRIGRQIAEGLAAAHATDLIHRDIKPGNVLLEGGQHKVKITDFGLARTADDASISQSGIIAGTPMYMAPEQAQGQTLDQRADLFSLGSVLYQMVAGRPPFRATSAVAVLKRVAEDKPRAIRDIIPETPQWLCDIIAKLHAKDPDDRYQSAREVADVLADCEAQLKANARLKDYSRIPRSTPPRWKWAAAAAVLIPFMALTATELTGITHLFHKQPGVVQSPNLAPSPEDSESEGWVQLFNGKDLTGWKKHLNAPAPWTVENGILKGSSSKGYLFSERGDYKNFHLRVEAMINGGGDCEISFRAPFDVAKVGPNLEYYGAPNCYITYIHKWVLLRDRPTPSIARVGPPREYPNSLFDVQDDSLIRPNEWFTLDLIADGNHFITKINGKEAANCTDPLSAYDTGHFALGLFGEATVVQFRKIEIKELPASSSPPAVAPFTDADVQRIAALPAPQQVQEVRKELMRRNPGFDGIVKHKIEDGVVTELKIVTDQVTDIAPIRVFDALRVLECTGTWTYSGPDDRPLLKASGQLADLTPLAGMNLASLTHLSLSATKAGDAGMVYFKDCKNLTSLNLLLTQVGDAGLVHFKDCKALTELNLAVTKVSDAGLANFKDCKNLTFLWLIHTQVGDAGMVHFQGCKALMNLGLARTKVGDVGLVHFKDCKNLTNLWLDHAPVGDAGLAQLKGIPLRKLYINNTAITDLAPLQGMPLEEVRLTPKNITRGLDILRDMKSLKTIGIAGQQPWPPAEFWERYDKGEFKE